MPRLLSTNLLVEKNRLSSDHVWSYLFQLDIQGAPVPYRLAAYDQDVLFHGLLYTRAALDIDQLEEPSHGALITLQVTVGNVDQEMIALFENYWVTVADPQWRVTIWTVDMAQVDETPLTSGEVFSVQQATTDYVTASVDLVAEGVTLASTIPKRRYCASSGFPFLPRLTR